MDVFKDPVTDPGKVSKKGRLDLVRDGTTREYLTYAMGSTRAAQPSELVEVCSNGRLVKEWSFAEVRARSEMQ